MLKYLKNAVRVAVFQKELLGLRYTRDRWHQQLTKTQFTRTTFFNSRLFQDGTSPDNSPLSEWIAYELRHHSAFVD